MACLRVRVCGIRLYAALPRTCNLPAVERRIFSSLCQFTHTVWYFVLECNGCGDAFQTMCGFWGWNPRKQNVMPCAAAREGRSRLASCCSEWGTNALACNRTSLRISWCISSTYPPLLVCFIVYFHKNVDYVAHLPSPVWHTFFLHICGTPPSLTLVAHFHFVTQFLPSLLWHTFIPQPCGTLPSFILVAHFLPSSLWHTFFPHPFGRLSSLVSVAHFLLSYTCIKGNWLNITPSGSLSYIFTTTSPPAARQPANQR